MLSRVGYVVVYVSDMDSMISFWRNKIGLNPSYVSDKWSEIPLDNIVLALHYAENPQPRNTGIIFHVKDIYNTVEKLKSRGVEVTGVQDIGVGFEAVFRDPEGNEYGIFQPK